MLIVPPITLSPIFLFAGTDSPVIMDSSIDDSPITITPSAAIFSPGFAITMSSTAISSESTSSSLPFLITIAVFGLRAIRFFNDSVVVFSTLLSRYSPIVNIVKTEEEASKNRTCEFVNSKVNRL